ncbi:L,D-transpeptidase [Sporomusa sp.]|uniref:L,D-transpeptidase n=1 Tax=Sporomusa sp. TaxID=2078658 RepID=UPI002C4D4D70|nr:L,D-transpeptidase [Sporomusa sp.]HWR06771.1 L,D-transpeptidase [Sporomusa sp.]
MLHRTLICFFVFLLLTGSAGYARSEAVASSITVNLPSRTMELFAGNNLVKEYPIAIGKPSTPTPLGNYSIAYKEVNPAWYPPDQKGKIVPSGPENPLGYRWMGIWNNYGIHGTNAPWSIGTVTSNGCIRMYEEDVEELFDKVSYGTPVQITYDRIKIKTNTKGQILLAVYPDVYGYGNITVQDIRNKLNAYHLNSLLADDSLRKIVNEANGSQVVIASQFKIRVNERLINERGLVVQNVQYVPVQPFAEALKQKINWDEKMKTVQCGSSSIPGIISGNMVYVVAENIPTLFGGEMSWKSEEDTLSFGKLVVFINGKQVNIGINRVQGILALSALELAEVMDCKVTWNREDRVLILTNKGLIYRVPVDMIGQDPYIKITSINQYFNAYVYWNEQAKTIELTYPY